MNPTNHWKLGLFVVTSTAALLAALAWIGASKLRRASIECHYYFNQTVDGLEVGAPVKFRGVPIGQVMRIHVAPDRRTVEVVGEIYIDSLEQLGLRDPDRPVVFGEGEFVPPDLRVQLVSSVLTGVSFIQGDFYDPERFPVEPYPFEVPWNTVHTVPSTLKSIEESAVESLQAMPKLVEETRLFLEKVSAAIDDLKIRRLSDDAHSLLATADERLRNLEKLEVLAKGSEALDDMQETLNEIQGLARDMRSEEGPLVEALDSYAAVGRQLHEVLGDSDLVGTAAAMRRLGNGAADASGKLGLLATEVRGEVDTLRRALEALSALAELLERDPGSLLRGRQASSPIEEAR